MQGIDQVLLPAFMTRSVGDISAFLPTLGLLVEAAGLGNFLETTTGLTGKWDVHCVCLGNTQIGSFFMSHLVSLE